MHTYLCTYTLVWSQIIQGEYICWLMNRILCFSENSSCVDQEQFKKLVATIIAAYDEGIIYGNNQSATNWNFGSSYFFAVTVATTIGK